ncbi:MAG: iron-sulfur cluster carrier protein ApbC [Thiotrichales bacterium]|nr:iron-sulfur cluster carrier protein ApbC [Thiotrichales bacterium]
MTDLNQDSIKAAIAQYQDPYLGTDLVSARAVKDISVDAGKVSIQLEPGFPCLGHHEELRGAVSAILGHMQGVSGVDIDIETGIASMAVQKGVKTLPEVKNTIAVASGKGGVGKSTTAINLALALQAEGANVGILDADIYGPSQPRMLGYHGKPDSVDGKSVEPNVSYRLQSMSIGYLIDEETPMIWRGPMATGALEQLIRDTHWKDLDYLVIDLPPGTGDIQLTLSQNVPLSGAIIVTTPQDIALLDARKALKMFEKVNVPVLGIVENMSVHICSECGHTEHIFGAGGGESMAAQYDVDLLGALPLEVAIREGVDNGKPTVAMQPDAPSSLMYREIARKAAAKLSLQAKDYSSRFPNIVVENK